MDLDSWSDLALRMFVNLSPSPQWANRQIEPYLGLPFGAYLRAPPPNRPRRLTAPLDLAQDSLWQRLSVLCGLETQQQSKDQEQSYFLFRLPYDVRVIIYEMVLGGQVFHCFAQNAKSRVTHYVCGRPGHIEEERSRHKCSDAFYDRPSTAAGQSSSATSSLLAPLLACRKMYSEAIGILYASNTFVFSQNFAAFSFLKLKIPQQRLSCFRHFRLHMRIPRHPELNGRASRDWIDLWTFFGRQMTGLQFLYLELQMLQPTEAQIEATSDDEAVSWLRPVVNMAVEANRRRGCVMEIEVRGITNRPADIFTDLERSHPDIVEEEIMQRSCAFLHRQIRLSLG